MKIAIFSDTFAPQINGVSTYVYQSALSLTALGHDVRIFIIQRPLRENEKTMELSKFDKNLQIHILPSLSFWGYPGERFYVALGLALNKIRKFKPDIIHTHTLFGVGWEAVYCSKLFNIPLIGTHHTFFDHYLKYIYMDYKFAKNFSWRYTTIYYNFCDLILSPTNSLAEVLKKYGVEKPINILPNFIDTDFFRPAPESSRDVKSLIYMGRVSDEKSIDQVIKSVAIVKNKISDIKLNIVGDGPARKSLENLVQKLKLEDNVIFSGFAQGQKLLDFLWGGSIFITASKSENMPLSVLEAMAVGLPIIGVDALGMPEIVKNDQNGFIIPSDKPEIMAEKILELIENNSLRKEFSLNSRKLAMNYSQEKVIKDLERIYQDLINGIIPSSTTSSDF